MYKEVVYFFFIIQTVLACGQFAIHLKNTQKWGNQAKPIYQVTKESQLQSPLYKNSLVLINQMSISIIVSIIQMLRNTLKAASLPDFNHTPRPYSGLSPDKIMQLREKHLFSAYFQLYKENLIITQGKMQYLFDHKGRRFLDLIGGISSISVGHSHPRIVEVIRKEAQKIVHTSSIYMNQAHALYSKALADKCPPGLDHVFFVNSGSQANTTVMTLLREYTQRNKVYVLRGGYHGNLLPLTSMGYWSKPLEMGIGSVERIAFPGQYQSNYQGPDRAEFYARQLEESILATSNKEIAGMFIEPIMGAGGLYTLPSGFVKRAFEIIKKYKGLCVTDEVQTGFGRLGSSYWGCEDQEVKPDIMAMAKSIGNGYPLGAVVTTKQISDCMKKSNFFTTFGGDPIACRVGHENLRLIDEENLQKRAETLGNRLISGLKRIQTQSRTMGDVRGKGMMIGVEFVKNLKTREPDMETTTKIFDEAAKRHVLLGKGGVHKNVLRIQPPMCLNEEDIDYTLTVLEDIIKQHKL